MVRERESGGGAAEGGRLTPAPPVPDALLRPLLQLALDVARAGELGVPTVDAPRALRPFLRFARLPDRALAAVRRCLDEDESFRSRVAAVATEELVGRAGVLYLERPDGWDDELAGLAAAASSAAEADREEREDRTARRRVTHAEEATQRAEETAARARAEAARAASELSHERRERRVAQEERDRLERRASSLEAEREAAHRRAAEASGEVERLRGEVASLTEQLREAHEVPPPAPAPAPPPMTAEPSVAVVPGPDLAEVARTVAAAGQAAAALGAALAEAAAALSPPPPTAEPPAGPATPAPGGRRAATAPRRRPVPLPPAVLDDTPEAAEHLVRVPGALVLVDGYNAAKLLWPSAPAVELRERLVDALSELEARSAADVHVVFDGADVPPPPPRPGGRRPVRVTFSPPDVEADDVILALVDAVPPTRPVVIASSDRRVQDGARRRGANVISSAQLGAVLRRS